MTTVLAIDPGPVVSAWMVFAEGKVHAFGRDENLTVVHHVASWDGCTPVIERIASYGMPVGDEVFETVLWTGRMVQAAFPRHAHRITRKAIVTHLCGSARAKDPNVRQALIDRWGGPAATRKGGALYGVTRDAWAALAVAVAWSEGAR